MVGENVDVFVRIILKEYDARVWNGLIWLSIGTTG
jgi:hypothetical protein